MAGIYLHIPFCKQACYYCNFHFSTSIVRKNDFVTALLAEMAAMKDYIGAVPVETIYFGGGTPSLLTETELLRIFEGLRTHFTIDKNAEITFEVNPDDIERLSGNLRSWRQAGINRLSIGVQSFYEQDLKWMNRAHSSGQAISSIQKARDEGFDNLSIDLIYGSPTLPDNHWEKNVEQAIKWEIPHLSCYALTVEPRTALDKMIRQKRKAAVDPDTQARQFLALMDWMSIAGYEHYEISNFALPGKRSRHNSSYWQGKPYLGLGPSAHSFNGSSRQWNVANNALYIDTWLAASLSSNHLPPNSFPGHANPSFPGENPLIEKEDLTITQQLNEYIMISLRTMEGCDMEQITQRFGKKASEDLAGRAAKFIAGGQIQIGEIGTLNVTGTIPEKGNNHLGNNQKLILTREGKLLADGIAAELFFE